MLIIIQKIFGWSFLLSVGLFFLCQPRIPKSDKRFRTGYKNNETVREKSDTERALQKLAILVGIVSAGIYLMLNHFTAGSPPNTNKETVSTSITQSQSNNITSQSAQSDSRSVSPVKTEVKTDQTDQVPVDVKQNTNEQLIFTTSFDCGKASTKVEQLKCSNKELAQADIDMAQAYRAALNKAQSKSELKHEQASWLKEQRNVCSDVASLMQVYKNRISQLSQ